MRTESAREVRMIGTRAPSTMPAASACGKEGQVLRQHIAGFEIGHHEDLRMAGDRRIDALDARRFRVDGIVEGERPFQQVRR